MKRIAVARIDESRCIGCVRCIDACPVDAIVGARGMMHTVVEPWCIGCALCLPACPVDCVAMAPAQSPWSAALRRAAGTRARRRRQRLRAAAPRSRPAHERRRLLAALLARKRA